MKPALESVYLPLFTDRELHTSQHATCVGPFMIRLLDAAAFFNPGGRQSNQGTQTHCLSLSKLLSFGETLVELKFRNITSVIVVTMPTKKASVI